MNKLLVILCFWGWIGSASAQDFAVKGFHLDLRCQVMTPKALRALADDLSQLGINTLVMEWEATYPYAHHATITNRYGYSKQEVTDFVAYCRTLGIDVIPLQQCFGHVEYILRHDRYGALREDAKEISQLCPLKDSAAVALFADLFGDLAANHPSPYIHIGGDETYLLGSCPKCRAKADNEGKSKLFVDYMKKMCDLVIGLGKTPVMWADIIIKHPEALDLLPRQTVFVDWNYGWAVDLFGPIDKLYDAGICFWGSPAVRSHPDNIYLTDWKKHFENQRDFIPYARSKGYQGMVMTSWSTSGLYSLVFDIGWEPEDLLPIRNVYPLSGFRILLAAYGQAVHQNEPLAIEPFVTQYAEQRFGLSADEAQQFYRLLMLGQHTVRHGQDSRSRPLAEVADEFRAATGQIHLLARQVRHHRQEFGHLVLMFDLRALYLGFKEVELAYQSPTFTAVEAPELYLQTCRLLAQGQRLSRRFEQLQRGYLYPHEIDQINQARQRKIGLMAATLKQLTQNSPKL